ncbi:hypothetical protein NC653_029014 [Populus alba x Populus x berolinensis]|uniref:Tify domain-containing protein n=1 Tax=Populus alba x Populus x berolinensis TaxID=444605 RepID=A0AAD6Q4R4_9ROSI|nr:hypothetical protein NC653_029014 [Populus alba x Populus x berolinensis]
MLLILTRKHTLAWFRFVANSLLQGIKTTCIPFFRVNGYEVKNMAIDKQAGNHYPVTTYGTQQFDAYSVNRPKDTRMFSISGQQNQTITVSMSSPILQSHFPPTGHNMLTNSGVPKPPGGVPVITPPSALPTPSSIIGTTDLRDGSKSSGAPAQLTIFYAGSVCVYDDVSPEKAQAIMFLAGNGGSSGTPNKPISTPQAQAPIRRPPVGDIFAGNKSNTTAPISCIPSPISVTSSNTNDLATVKPVVSLASSVKQTEPPKPLNSPGPASATLVPAVAVPQARKASLARFLEKRKESLGARVPPETKPEKGDINMSDSGECYDSKRPIEDDDDDDDIVESDIDLDNTDVVEPDNDPPQKMGDPAVEVTEEKRDAAQTEKAKAMDAISEGNLDEAIDHLTEAIVLNPISAILYATRASVFVKLKKPHAAICDADAALAINPNSAKGYKVRGMARAMLGQWEQAASDLQMASKLDYDDEIGSVLKKVICRSVS